MFPEHRASYCQLTGCKCVQGSTASCPEPIGNIYPWCKHIGHGKKGERKEQTSPVLSPIGLNHFSIGGKA